MSLVGPLVGTVMTWLRNKSSEIVTSLSQREIDIILYNESVRLL